MLPTRSSASLPATIGLGFGSWQVTSPALTSLAMPTVIFNLALLPGLP